MINSFVHRFQEEQLDADLDISLSHVVAEDKKLTVTSQAGSVRLILGALFMLPGLWLLWQALSTRSGLLILAAILCCPVLFIIGLFLGCLRTGKSFDVDKHLVTRSVGIFQYTTIRTEALPPRGTVRLWSEYDAGGEGPGCWWHNVTVEPCRGCNFTIARHYRRARSFAEQLAQSLRYELTDVSEPRSRG